MEFDNATNFDREIRAKPPPLLFAVAFAPEAASLFSPGFFGSL
jgi:hypothetical protein